MPSSLAIPPFTPASDAASFCALSAATAHAAAASAASAVRCSSSACSCARCVGVPRLVELRLGLVALLRGDVRLLASLLRVELRQLDRLVRRLGERSRLVRDAAGVGERRAGDAE